MGSFFNLALVPLLGVELQVMLTPERDQAWSGSAGQPVVYGFLISHSEDFTT